MNKLVESKLRRLIQKEIKKTEKIIREYDEDWDDESLYSLTSTGKVFFQLIRDLMKDPSFSLDVAITQSYIEEFGVKPNHAESFIKMLLEYKLLKSSYDTN